MERPFAAFAFAVELSVPDVSDELVGAAFAECDGLEMTMDVKSLREGGDAVTHHRLAGNVTYGQVTLKRGMTPDSFQLWSWFDAVAANPALRAEGEIVVFSPDGGSERARYVLDRCLPVKLKAPPLNAKDGLLAIEELQLVYDSLSVRPGGGGAGLGIGVGIGGGGVSVGVSIGA